jgi:hypothetical protein
MTTTIETSCTNYIEVGGMVIVLMVIAAFILYMIMEAIKVLLKWAGGGNKIAGVKTTLKFLLGASIALGFLLGLLWLIGWFVCLVS